MKCDQAQMAAMRHPKRGVRGGQCDEASVTMVYEVAEADTAKAFVCAADIDGSADTAVDVDVCGGELVEDQGLAADVDKE